MEQLWIFSMILLLLLSLSVVYFLKQLWLLRKCPPGPLPLPLIGITWQTGYKVVKHGLINHSDDFSERVETPFLRALSRGKGIILSNGHTWKQQRRFGLLTMRKLGVGRRGIESQIQDEAGQLPFDPLLPVTNTFFNLIAILVFGYRFSLEDENFQKLTKGLIFGSRFVGSFFHLYEVLPWLMHHIPGPHQKTLSHIKFIYDLAKEEIEKHKENQSLHEPRDFIDYYLLQLKS
ncbi:putative Cytochrome P450 2J2-like protein, partial [Naja naja]